MADIDAALVEQILDVPKGERKTDVEHHLQADNLGRRFEATEWVVLHDPEKLDGGSAGSIWFV